MNKKIICLATRNYYIRKKITIRLTGDNIAFLYAGFEVALVGKYQVAVNFFNQL